MTLPASGPISFRDINIEMDYSPTQNMNLNQQYVRALARNYVLQSEISFANFYGKTRSWWDVGSHVTYMKYTNGSNVNHKYGPGFGTVDYWWHIWGMNTSELDPPYTIPNDSFHIPAGTIGNNIECWLHGASGGPAAIGGTAAAISTDRRSLGPTRLTHAGMTEFVIAWEKLGSGKPLIHMRMTATTDSDGRRLFIGFNSYSTSNTSTNADIKWQNGGLVTHKEFQDFFGVGPANGDYHYMWYGRTVIEATIKHKNQF